jgi:hypothetical protein
MIISTLGIRTGCVVSSKISPGPMKGSMHIIESFRSLSMGDG